MNIYARRDFLKTLLGSVAAGAFWPWLNQVDAADRAMPTQNSVPKRVNAADSSLWERAANKGIIYGAAGRYNDLRKDPEYAAAFSRECKMLVPEIELKWSNLCDKTGAYDFSKVDWLLNFAKSNGMLFRGHTLVWHYKLPVWFQGTVTRQNAEQTMVRHISKVASRYAGHMHSWDVVNEAIAPGDGRQDGLRRSPWLELLGPDYIDLAFRVAATVDPNALLVYNDYEIEFDTRKCELKREATLKLLSRLKSAGVPVHALGIQAHVWGQPINQKKLQEFLRSVQRLGLKILITELDGIDKGMTADISARDLKVAGLYEEYLSVVLENPAVISVVTWGLSDRHTYLTQWHPRKDGLPVRPLPLDANLKRKPAWEAIANAFDNAPVRKSI